MALSHLSLGRGVGKGVGGDRGGLDLMMWLMTSLVV
jgi:hypothetical protein